MDPHAGLLTDGKRTESGDGRWHYGHGRWDDLIDQTLDAFSTEQNIFILNERKFIEKTGKYPEQLRFRTVGASM